MDAWRTILGLAAALCAACGGPPAAPPLGHGVLDLAGSFPVAAVATEVPALVMGDAEARSHLVSGWGADESDANGPYVWGLGEESIVELFVADPIDVTLGLRCAPFLFDGAPTQSLRVTLNGRLLREIPLPEAGLYEIEAPASTLRSGGNRLVLGYGVHHRPRDVVAGSGDERELAVLWRGIELRGLGAKARPATDGPREVLSVPVGSEVSYSFDFPGPIELTAGALVAEGEDDVELVARFETAGTPALWTGAVAARGEALRLSLPPVQEGIGRLTLTVRRRRSLRGFFGRSDENAAVALRLPMVRAVAPSRAPRRAVEEATARPDVIVYMIDTLRADHLGTYGYRRPTSPEIDRFAAGGIVFEQAFAQSSWTRPTVVSTLTGLRPRVHGVNGRNDALSPSVETVAEMLSAEGYETMAFVTNGNVGPEFAVDQGFSIYRYLRERPKRPGVHILSGEVNERVFRHLASRAPGAPPLFLYVHVTDPHAPYYPPQPFRRRFAPEVDPELGLLSSFQELMKVQRQGVPPAVRQGLIDLYDAEIASNDHSFGVFLERLRGLGLYEDSLIVLLADHGELFFDHRALGHGQTLYNEEIRVPLVVKLPRGEGAGTRSAAPVEQIDVVPTILDVAGLVQPARLEGKSLRLPGARERKAFAILDLADFDVRSVLARGFKLVLDDSARRHGAPVQLYHLEAGLQETEELAAKRPLETAFLLQTLRRMELATEAGGVVAPEEAELSDEMRRQLEALGYVN